MKKYLFRNIVGAILFAVLFVDVIFLIGCMRLRPGADPLVVRVEQSEAVSKSSFDLVLRVDNLDRGFWRTNAPAFHGFCEWLRYPVPVWKTNTLPRASAMIANLNTVKVDYKQARASSNDLYIALITLQSAANQASAWAAIVTNSTAR